MKVFKGTFVPASDAIQISIPLSLGFTPKKIHVRPNFDVATTRSGETIVLGCDFDTDAQALCVGGTEIERNASGRSSTWKVT